MTVFESAQASAVSTTHSFVTDRKKMTQMVLSQAYRKLK